MELSKIIANHSEEKLKQNHCVHWSHEVT